MLANSLHAPTDQGDARPRLCLTTLVDWPVAQVSQQPPPTPMAAVEPWHQASRRHYSSSTSSSSGCSRARPVLLCTSQQQAHGSVRHHVDHHHHHHGQQQQQLQLLQASALWPSTPSTSHLGHGGVAEVRHSLSTQQYQSTTTSAAFSTADIRRALRLLAAKRDQLQVSSHSARSAFIKTAAATATRTRTPAHRLERALDWETESCTPMNTETTSHRCLRHPRPRRQAELSPSRLVVVATAEFKSSDSEQKKEQQSEKNDLRQAHGEGGEGGVRVRGDRSGQCDEHLESCDCDDDGGSEWDGDGKARVVASVILEKSPLDDAITNNGKRQGVSFRDRESWKLATSQLVGRIGGEPRDGRERSKSKEPIDAPNIRSIERNNNNSHYNKLGLKRASPGELSYANGNQLLETTTTRLVSELSVAPSKKEVNEDEEGEEQQQVVEGAIRAICRNEQAPRRASSESEAMTTGSFVSTEPLSRQQVNNLENLEPEESLRPQQQQQQHQQERSQFNLTQQHQQLARPIGLGCSESACTSSSSLSSEDQLEQIEQQQQQQQENKGHAPANTMNQVGGVERYTIISSSSVVSLSEHSDRAQRDYGGSHQNRADRSATASSSVSALNQQGGSSGGKKLIGKLVGKKASRFRELLLQNLGRADRTTDELFDLSELNFYKQQQHVQQLIKEFKLYTNALKSYHEASRSLSKCIQQSTSDYQLARHDLACDNLSQLDQLNEDLMDKLHEKVIKSLSDYLTRFDEIKEKINKRHRKLIDYDSSRRLYELMFARVSKKRSSNAQQQQQMQQQPQQQQPQQNYQSILRGLKFLSQQQQQPPQQPPAGQNYHAQHQESAIASQLVDEARLLKLREQYNYCKLMYETINGELHEEMPLVYERKMKSLLNALQNYYDIEAHYHSNAGKLIAKVSEVMAVLKPQTASDDANTILSMYDDSNDGKSSSRREMTGAGSGSSGVSLSGSASRSSGSSLASPDCDDQHHRQTEHNVDDGEDEGEDEQDGSGGDDYDDRQEQQNLKDVERPEDDLEDSVRMYVEVPPGPVSEEVDDSAAVALVSGLDSCHVADKPACDDSNDGEELCPDGAGPDDDKSCESSQEKEGPGEGGENQADMVKIEKVPVAIGEPPVCVGADETDVKLDESEPNDELDTNSEQKEYLYRVRTNYKYLAEDVDELCFDANEIIQVIEFDENHEPEDGWLLGIREVNKQRGLFPANFTQPI